jgi:hypothetical protein
MRKSIVFSLLALALPSMSWCFTLNHMPRRGEMHMGFVWPWEKPKVVSQNPLIAAVQLKDEKALAQALQSGQNPSVKDPVAVKGGTAMH